MDTDYFNAETRWRGGAELIAEQFAKKLVGTMCACRRQVNPSLRYVAGSFGKHTGFVQAMQTLIMKVCVSAEVGRVEFRCGEVKRQHCKHGVVELLQIEFPGRQRPILWPKRCTGIPSLDDYFGWRVLLVIGGEDAVVRSADGALDKGAGLVLTAGFNKLRRTSAEGTREQIGLFHEGRVA